MGSLYLFTNIVTDTLTTASTSAITNVSTTTSFSPCLPILVSQSRVGSGAVMCPDSFVDFRHYIKCLLTYFLTYFLTYLLP